MRFLHSPQRSITVLSCSEVTSKTAVTHYTQELPVSLGCHAVSPGAIQTGFNTYSVTQLNDAKLNAASTLCHLAGT